MFQGLVDSVLLITSGNVLSNFLDTATTIPIATDIPTPASISRSLSESPKAMTWFGFFFPTNQSLRSLGFNSDSESFL